MDRNIKFSENYFFYYCKINNNYIKKIDKNIQLSSFDYSSVDLYRYKNLHLYLVKSGLFNDKIRILDLGCFVGLYVNFLNSIGLKNTLGIDICYEAILFGKKLGINNIEYGDILKLDTLTFLSGKKFNVISILHTFEKYVIDINGDSFIFNTLKQCYKFLDFGGIVYFTLADGYYYFDKDSQREIRIPYDCKFNERDILKIGYKKFVNVSDCNYILIK